MNGNWPDEAKLPSHSAEYYSSMSLSVSSNRRILALGQAVRHPPPPWVPTNPPRKFRNDSSCRSSRSGQAGFVPFVRFLRRSRFMPRDSAVGAVTPMNSSIASIQMAISNSTPKSCRPLPCDGCSKPGDATYRNRSLKRNSQRSPSSSCSGFVEEAEGAVTARGEILGLAPLLQELPLHPTHPPGTAAPPAAIPGVPQSGTPAPGGPAPAPANNSLGGPPRLAAEAGSKPTTTRKRSATLPEEYVAKDTNGDGQLGLYEWPRTDFATFHKLDLNNDGFVTAAELLRKDKPRAAAPSVNPGASTVAMGGAGGPPAAGGGWGSPARSEPIRQPGSGESGGGGGGGDRSRGGGPGRGSMPPAERAFTALDIDKNGSLSEEEWERSVSVKAQFEREGITLTFPLFKADFESKYPQRR